jgi:hypothetical protein
MNNVKKIRALYPYNSHTKVHRKRQSLSYLHLLQTYVSKNKNLKHQIDFILFSTICCIVIGFINFKYEIYKFQIYVYLFIHYRVCFLISVAVLQG